MKKLFYILSLIALVGCYSNNCPVNNLVTCNYYFYNVEGEVMAYPYNLTVSGILPGGQDVYVYHKMSEESITSTKLRPDLDSLGYTMTRQHQRNDTVLVNKASSLKYVQVQMSYFNPVDTLLFRYSNLTMPDTVYVQHESYAHVDIPECGSYRYHNITNVWSTNNAIDHIELINPVVNYDQEANINIYFYDITDAE